jgi:hypothetical protein
LKEIWVLRVSNKLLKLIDLFIYYFNKYINRLYFTLSTTTTIGFGDMSAKTKLCKIIVVIHMIVIIFEILLALLHKKKIF